jgi:hypothetical protein
MRVEMKRSLAARMAVGSFAVCLSLAPDAGAAVLDFTGTLRIHIGDLHSFPATETRCISASRPQGLRRSTAPEEAGT